MNYLHNEIQRAVNNEIYLRRHQYRLPLLSYSGFLHILNIDSRTPDVASENDRLEFLGDAMIHASLGRLVHKEVPRGNPDLYTRCCSALWSNLTFCRLAEATDIYSSLPSHIAHALERQTFGTCGSVQKDKFAIKRTADLFEAILGAYHQESGFQLFDDWVQFTFTPLIYIAVDAYWKNCSISQSKRLRRAMEGRQSSDARKHRSVRSTPVRTARAMAPPPMSRKTHHPTLDQGSVSRWAHQVETSKSVKSKQLARKQHTVSQPLQTRKANVDTMPAAMAPSIIPNKHCSTPIKPPSTSRKSILASSKLATPAASPLTFKPFTPTTPTNPDCDTTLVDDSFSPSSSEKFFIDLTQDEDNPVLRRMHARKRRSAAPSPEPMFRQNLDVTRLAQGAMDSLIASTSACTLSDMQISDSEFGSEEEVETALFPTGSKLVASTSYLRHPIAFTLLSRCPSPCS